MENEDYVFDLKKYSQNISAYIQILPSFDPCWKDVKILEDNKTIYVRCSQDFQKETNSTEQNYWTFETDGVLYNLNQTNVYKNIHISETLGNAISGIDVLLFSYGQTGTGKSSTIYGLLSLFECRGITPRLISELFELKEKYKTESEISFTASFVEIHRTHVEDLLAKNKERRIRAPYTRLKRVPFNSVTDALKILFHVEGERNVIHEANYFSHLLTSVFTIYIKNSSLLTSKPIHKFSKIHIIDMAGIDTEGQNKSCWYKNGTQIGTGNLNKSQLDYCIKLLQQEFLKEKKLIKDAGVLVDFLGNSLKLSNIIKFIGHIRTTRDDLRITTSILRLAQKIHKINSTPKMVPFIENNPQLQINYLEKELTYMKDQIYLNSMLMNEDLSYNITQERLDQMRNAVDDFIKNKSTNLAMLNVTDANVAVKCFKDMYHQLQEENKMLENKLNILKPPSINSKETILNTSSLIIPQTSKDLKKGSKAKIKRSRTGSISRSSRKKSIEQASKQESKFSSVKLKSNNNIGTLSNAGFSLGQMMSYNYEGDVTKSLKKKSKYLKIEEKSSQISDKTLDEINERISDINLPSEIGDDYEIIWNLYKADESYSYSVMNEKLQQIENDSQKLLKLYNNKLNKLQEQIYSIDVKKKDLFKVKMYKESADIKCSNEDGSKTEAAEERLTISTVELKNNTMHLREELLVIQAELKINIDEYHRIKNNITQDFRTYCTDTFKFQLPVTNQINECIEDKLAVEEILLPQVNVELMKEQEFFYKLQEKLIHNYLQNEKLRKIPKGNF